MTDHPSSRTDPSMEDILASIRRIIDDEEGQPSEGEVTSLHGQTPQNSWPPAGEPVSPYAIDEAAAALAREEYDAALSTPQSPADEPNPEEETIFPERGGALWRRVAGHPLSEGETDPLPADETFDLTETLDGDDDDALELNELLDTTSETALETVVKDREIHVKDPETTLSDPANASFNSSFETPEPTESDADDSTVVPLGVGAMTAAGIGATSAFGSNAMDRIADRVSGASGPSDEDDEDEVLDLTRRLGDDGTIDEMTSSLDPSAAQESDDLPSAVFERVTVGEDGEDRGDDEILLDQSFETVAVTGLETDYSDALAEGSADDARERALDDRFYRATDRDDPAPDLEEDYADSLGAQSERTALLKGTDPEGAPSEDELDTVGGLVRDALRSRLPAPEPDQTPLVTGGAEDAAARSLATLARYDAQAPRRIYGGIKITEDDDSPTIEHVVQDTLRPMLRDWLNDNLPTLVENMVKQEVERISARSRRFTKDD